MYLLIGVSVQNYVAIFMNKYELAKKINELEGLTNDEKSELIKLLRSQKKYGLVWEDKPEDAEQRMVNEQPVLVEVPERAILSDDSEAPNHILIEGDNLEALTALSYTHTGKIDVIYIDPPYNTGNKDFVYNDSFVDKENGYRHSMWLSFMNKRLKIAKNLLSEKGVIFISIDDNEQAQLKMLCDEIFGEGNYVGSLPRVTKKSGKAHSDDIARNHDYVLVFSKCSGLEFNGIPSDAKGFDNQDEFVTIRGKYKVNQTLDYDSLWYNPTMDFPLVVDGIEYYPGGSKEKHIARHSGEHTPKDWVWRWSQAKFEFGLANGFVVFKKGRNGVRIYTKTYLNASIEKNDKGEYYVEYKDRSTKMSSLIFVENEYSNDNAKKELGQCLNANAFDFPKPTSLIKKLMSLSMVKNSTILDFFAGSGTTLHATMQLNAEDGGHRQCILVTNNENGICENVTYERNRRVIQGYTTPKGEKIPGLTRNNLRYYKTKFVPRDKSPKNLRNLMALSTDMLCIHNDTYIEKPFAGKNINNKIARYFESNDGSKRMLVIYRAEAIQALVELMKQEFKNGESKENGKLMVYVFSPNGYAYDDEFEDVADCVSLCAMPDAVLNAYRRVLPKKRQAQLLEDVAEETDSEARTVEESDLFQNQTYTMAASEIKDNREGGDE